MARDWHLTRDLHRPTEDGRLGILVDEADEDLDDLDEEEEDFGDDEEDEEEDEDLDEDE
jgi:hypothetical protein